MKFIAIVAISTNRAIGKNGKIPWYIPDDFEHFKKTTLGSPIIMGRKTYESIGRPLPGRENIVLTRGQFSAPGITVFYSISELLEYSNNKTQPAHQPPSLPSSSQPPSQPTTTAFICWGSQIYSLFFDAGLVDEVILSRIDMEIEWADAYFPVFETGFELQPEKTDRRNGFTIEYWKKKV